MKISSPAILAMSLFCSFGSLYVTAEEEPNKWSEKFVKAAQSLGLDGEEVGEYSAERKEIKPITIATYQIITYRPRKSDEDVFPHFSLFNERNWGLIIYDEVHPQSHPFPLLYY